METPFIIGNKYYLRPLLKKDLNEKYLAWMNDPTVNTYSNRIFFPTGFEELEKYYNECKDNSILLAIVDKKSDLHIGNILLGPIRWKHRCAEISIVVGDKNYWNKGAATEAIYLITKHAFKILKLNRVESGSSNAAYINVADKKLGWMIEGKLRQQRLCKGKFIDVTIMSMLRKEFKVIKKYEK